MGSWPFILKTAANSLWRSGTGKILFPRHREECDWNENYAMVRKRLGAPDGATPGAMLIYSELIRPHERMPFSLAGVRYSFFQDRLFHISRTLPLPDLRELEGIYRAEILRLSNLYGDPDEVDMPCVWRDAEAPCRVTRWIAGSGTRVAVLAEWFEQAAFTVGYTDDAMHSRVMAEEEQKGIVLFLDYLATRYSQSPAAASVYYAGRRVRLMGRLLLVTRLANGGYLAALAGRRETCLARCYLSESGIRSLPDSSSFSPGAEVVVSATVRELRDGILMLNEAEISAQSMAKR